MLWIISQNLKRSRDHVPVSDCPQINTWRHYMRHWRWVDEAFGGLSWLTSRDTTEEWRHATMTTTRNPKVIWEEPCGHPSRQRITTYATRYCNHCSASHLPPKLSTWGTDYLSIQTSVQNLKSLAVDEKLHKGLFTICEHLMCNCMFTWKSEL